MANQRGGAVCRGCARSSATHHKVGTNGCPSRVVSKPSTAPRSSLIDGRPWTLHFSADMTVIGIPGTHSIILYVRVHLSLMHAVTFTRPLLLPIYLHFQGTSSSQPSNARIESSVSERWATVASGSVAWIVWRSKTNASSILSVCPLPLQSAAC